MTPLDRLYLLAIAALAGVLPAPATAAQSTAGQSAVVLDEQFNDIEALQGWSFNNASQPPGLGWFQGNASIFPAHRGAPDAYIAANFLSAQGGSGSIDNWLITPVLNLAGATTLSFYSRAAQAPGFYDKLEVRFGSGGNFATVLATLGGAQPLGDSWQQFGAKVDHHGAGQFAFRYIGDAATANYIGLDSLRVTAVPEPAAWLLLVAGACTLAALRRQRQP